MEQIAARMQQKHGLEVDWNSSTFVPLKGELIVYDPDESYNYARLKIGDGINVPVALPFLAGNGPGGSGGSGGSDGTNYFTITMLNNLESRIITVPEGETVILKFTYSSVDEEGIDDGPGIG
jgi:hypothetical protein